MIEPDTYFFSPQEALRVASLQNRSDDVNGYYLQLCYYNGEKIDSDLVNLIHLPIDNIIDNLAIGRYRIPTNINFTGLDISLEIAKEIERNLFESLNQARLYRAELNKIYKEKSKNATLDFSEPLRFYLRANGATRVMQHVSKNIADVLKERGYNVFYDLLLGIEDLGCLKNIFEYNPHVTININHLLNTYISDAVFNFVWFQDSMPMLTNDKPIYLRDRDFIFSYHTMFEKFLTDKGVDKEKIFRQTVIPVDTKQFYLDKSIKREDKVVFVGTYYKNVYPHYIDQKTAKKLDGLLENGKPLSIENLESIFTSYLMKLPDSTRFVNYIKQSYIRNRCVSWLCQSDTKKIEVYGYNWKECGDENIINKFNGEIEKEKLNKLYNSAKYVLSASGGVINTQRLGELVHAGAIPIVYDSRDITDEDETWDDECLYFKTKEELQYILDNNVLPKKYRTEKMLQHFTYDKFLETMITIINDNIKEE